MMLESAKRFLLLALPLIIALACQTSFNPPGQLVLLTPTARAETATQTATPTDSAVLATREPTGTPTAAPTDARAGTPTPGVPDLNGVWDDNGYLIVIVQQGARVSAAYIEERICDHADGTGARTPFRHDFNATLQFEDGAWVLKGDQLTVCGFGYDDPSLNGVRQTSMIAVVSEDANAITGDWYHLVDAVWVIDGLRITRQFEGGQAVPTPTGFVLPSPAP